MIHSADGELFRESLVHASERCRLAALCRKDRDLLEQASRAFRLPRRDLLQRATEMARSLGAPWSQHEKYPALAACLTLREGARQCGTENKVALTSVLPHMHALSF
jgi:hypothetical protein